MNEFPIDHDLHCHTHLSGCSNDPEQTPENKFQKKQTMPQVKK